MTERVSRFSRAEAPRPFVLTARDAEIVLACWSHRWLTRQQLQRIVTLPGAGRTNDRLRRLFDAGLLARLRAGTVGAGLQPVYAAGEAAVRLIARDSGLAEAHVRARLRDDAQASAVLLPHDLQANDLRIALSAAAARRDDLRMEAWLNAYEAYDAYAAGRSLRPDGYFQVWQADTLHAFYVELDRGTTGLPRWSAKCSRYAEYRNDGHYARRHGLQRFRVLTTTTSERRLQELRAATERIASRGFWFALTQELLDDAAPGRMVWRPAGREERRALIPEAPGR